MVILAGKAARLTTTVMAIAPIANGQKIKWLPVNSIASKVNMVKAQPCPAIPIAAQSIRFSSCLSVQLINFFHKEAGETCLLYVE